MESLAARTGFLRSHQNADGGWGYFPRKQSWLEPTAYAALALLRAGDPEGAGRAWRLVESWRNPDGGWRPNRHPGPSTWCTALAVLLASEIGDLGAARTGTRWLVSVAGAESGLLNRLVRVFGFLPAGRQVEHRGWPWRPGSTSWVEPTALSLAALKRVARQQSSRLSEERIRTGERMLLSVRCPDGGWNYGSAGALGVDLPSYPETTALALIGLQNAAPESAIVRARNWLAAPSPSPLARAWLTLALRTRGDAPSGLISRWESRDLLVCALECLGVQDHWRVFAPGGVA